jgi:hypothetical protein
MVLLTEEAKQILQDHLDLGTTKPVSYLPIATLEKVLGLTASEYAALVEQSGNRVAIFEGVDCCIRSGAIYAYSDDDLAALLVANRTTLQEHRWPTTSTGFIKRLAAQWVDDGPILPIIRKAFGEL